MTARRALESLAELLGVTVRGLSDEHARWSLYEGALREPQARALLFDATSHEPDLSVKVGVILAVVEESPDDEGRRWIDLLPAGERALPEQRLGDCRRLRDLSGLDIAVDPPEEWSDWLQRRVAVSASAPMPVLQRLRDEGRTKRVRNAARETIDSLRARPGR